MKQPSLLLSAGVIGVAALLLHCATPLPGQQVQKLEVIEQRVATPSTVPATAPTTAPGAPSALVAAAPVPPGTATVVKADDTTISGVPLRIENGALVLSSRGADGKPSEVSVPLADVVEVRLPNAPASSLANTAPPSQKHGVSARYFNSQFWKGENPRDNDFKVIVTGEPDVVTTVANLTHDYGAGSPDPKIQNDNFSTAFFGKVRTKEAGNYWFLGFSDDDHYLYVNGQLVSSDPGSHGPRDPRYGERRESVVQIKLDANTDYDFLYLHNENVGDSSASVKWIPPSGQQSVSIPEENLSPDTGVPAAPAKLNVSDVKDTELTLTWTDAATNEIRYVVERSTDAGFSSRDAVARLPINSTTHTDSGLTKGKTYFYRVRAENFEGAGPWATLQITAAAGAKPVVTPTSGPSTGLAGIASAGAPAAYPPVPGEPGFYSLFDGKTLKGWDGDSRHWSVRDGALAGESVPDSTEDGGYLIWAGGEAADFELKFSYKLGSGNPRMNSGMNFRSKVLDKSQHRVGGYQADIEATNAFTGGLWDQDGVVGNRQSIAAHGEKVTYAADGTKQAERLGPADEELVAAIHADDWNEYDVLAEGDHIVLKINGKVMADVTDRHPMAMRTGVLAMQIESHPTTVQFKNIRIRPIRNGVKFIDATPAAPVAATRPAGTGPWTVRLAGGDRLTGEIAEWSEKHLSVRTAGSVIGIPSQGVSEVWHGSPDLIKKAREAAPRNANEDVALVERDGRVLPVQGLVVGLEGGSLSFRYRDQDRKIAIDHLVGVILGGQQKAKVDESLHQAIVLTSGDTLSGTWESLDDRSLQLKTHWGETLKLPLRDVAAIKTRNGRLVYVSDLKPMRVEQVPYFDRVIPYQVDKSLTGGPLQLSDGSYVKGIAVHSRCVLHYDIAGKYERFRTKVGFQQPEGKAGECSIRVLGDGKPLFAQPDARGDQKPTDVDVSVANVRLLTLEVDFGKNQDVADRVVWANARLLRGAGAAGARAAR